LLIVVVAAAAAFALLVIGIAIAVRPTESSGAHWWGACLRLVLWSSSDQ
jgi:hypothetical protein